MSHEPLVSVVLPTRNRHARLSDAVASVLAQQAVSLELIVVDDASTDDTPTVLEAIALADPRVRLVRNPVALGAAGSRNRGLAVARGTFVAFNDDDCRWSPDKLQRQLAQFTTPGIGVAYCGIRVGTRIVAVPDAAGAGGLAALRKRGFIGPPTVMVRRACLDAVGGFDASLPALEDWELWLRLAARTQFAFDPTVLVETDDDMAGLSRHLARQTAAVEQLWSAFRCDPSLDRTARADLAGALAFALTSAGALRHARRWYRQAWRLAPTSPRLAVLTLCAHLGPVGRGLLAGARRVLATRWGARCAARFWAA